MRAWRRAQRGQQRGLSSVGAGAVHFLLETPEKDLQHVLGVKCTLPRVVWSAVDNIL